MQSPIEVLSYNPEWPAMFASEAKLLQQALGDNCIAIHHIGSTSVPNLPAKPIIDILPVVKEIQQVDKATTAMEALGYEAKGEFGIAFRRYFQKGHPRTHNVHIFQQNDTEIDRHLLFRDWMRSHPADAADYAQLKLNLASSSTDILQYCNGKDAFIASIDAKTGYSGYRMVQALTEREWAAIQRLTNQPLPSPLPGHIHFVLYKNNDIVGYAHIESLPDFQAQLKQLIIDNAHRNQGLGSQFLALCKRWVSHHGFHKLIPAPEQISCSFLRKKGL